MDGDSILRGDIQEEKQVLRRKRLSSRHEFEVLVEMARG